MQSIHGLERCRIQDVVVLRECGWIGAATLEAEATRVALAT
jgi:hypothetical protein